MKLCGAWLCIAALVPAVTAIEARTLFHPKHHGAHKSGGKSKHAVKHVTAVPAAPAVAAAVQKQASVEIAAKSAVHEQKAPPLAQAALPTVSVAVAQTPVLTVPEDTPVLTAPEGVPRSLPAVSSMLGSAAETLKQINTQANVLEARVVQTQMENEARMSRQKAVFEQKLKEQDQENRNIEKNNARVSQEIGGLKKSNLETEKHAKELQVTNHLIRVELSTLKSKLAVSREFLAASLLSTDDSKAADLDVLEDQKNRKQGVASADAKKASSSQEDDDGEDDDSKDSDSDDDDDSATSFLMLKSSTATLRSDGSEEDSEDVAEAQDPADKATTDPRDLLKVLSSGVDNLETQEKESEAKLKQMFLQNFREGTKKRKSLLAQQKQLNATRATLLDYQGKLKTADGHLEGTKGKLEQRLHGLAAFLQKLSAIAMGPVNEAATKLNELPSGVTIPDSEGTEGALALPTAAEAAPVVDDAAVPAASR